MEKNKQHQNSGCKVRRLQPNLINEKSNLLRSLQEFSTDNLVVYNKQYLIMVVPTSEYERLGNLISRLQSFIESRIPHRENHLYLIIRDRDGYRENLFKFWKNVPD